MTLRNFGSAVLLTTALLVVGQDGAGVPEARTAGGLFVLSLRQLSALFPRAVNPAEVPPMVTAGFRG